MKMNRRRALKASIAAGTTTQVSSAYAQVPRSAVDPDFRIQNGRIKQSVMGWCFNPMPPVELAKHCKAMGMHAMEGIGANHYPAIRKLGLEIAIVGSHGFKDGPSSKENHASCIKKLTDGIDLAAEINSPNVITFTGMKVNGLDRDEMAANCVECWKQVMSHAESKGVNLCLEHLNSRDDSHPMKGHPGYFGDDVDFCVELIKKVGSPRMKLLFDCYHVSVMNGDIIRRIRQYKDYIGHYHTAGNPGRGELDDTQEINYPPIMKAILETDYQGYVAQEFIPTWDNKIESLRHGVMVCDV